MFDIKEIRGLFPVLDQRIKGSPLVYFDNAATTHKPLSVIDATTDFYSNYNSNVHRAIHTLGEKATTQYELAREAVANFINAASPDEVIFTKGTTEGINLVASSFGKTFFQPGDRVIISHMEHHANIVPWQLLKDQMDIDVAVVPINHSGELDLSVYEELLTDNTKLVSIVHISNSLGTVNPVEQIIQLAHKKNIPVMLDGAHGPAHAVLDVQKLDCDFYVFSGHKMYGPTGVGVLYGKRKWLEELTPYQGGGEMIQEVTLKRSVYADIPHKFEAGTPNIAGAIGLGAAVKFIESVGVDAMRKHDKELLTYAMERINQLDDIRVIGTASNKIGIISFLLGSMHAHDVGTVLDEYGVATRSGHHCTMPLMQFYNVPSTSRASFAVYNTKEEIDLFIDAITQVKKVFKLC